jgi:membrane carboxypeptidase/penicillin-binding protein
LRSTLDSPVQAFAADKLRHHLLAIGAQHVYDGAVVVVENHSGDVVAIERKVLTPASLLEDEPIVPATTMRDFVGW